MDDGEDDGMSRLYDDEPRRAEEKRGGCRVGRVTEDVEAWLLSILVRKFRDRGKESSDGC